MALSQIDLDNIDSAIAASELEVTVDGKSIKYRSIAELLKARQHVADVLAASGAGAAGSRRSRVFRYNFSTLRE